MHKLDKCSVCGSGQLYRLFTKQIPKSPPWTDFLSPAALPCDISGLVCGTCGFIFKSPVFDEPELARLYNLDGAPISAEALQLASRNAARRAADLYAEVSPWLPGGSTHVLDVGGRNGELMTRFLEHGHRVSVLDMDGGQPVDTRIEKIRNPFTALHGRTFDAVTMLHVLEHVESPREFLAHASTLLPPGGLVYVEVPSELLTPLVFRHIGDHRHLVYFTRESLTSVFRAAGFDCLNCTLTTGFVGAPLPVLRAIGRKATPSRHWQPRRGAVFRSLREVAHPLPWKIRALNAMAKAARNSDTPPVE